MRKHNNDEFPLVEYFIYNGWRYFVAQDLFYILNYSKKESVWRLEFEPLGIRVEANSPVEAHQRFIEELALLWDNFGSQPDKALTKEHIKLKVEIRKWVLKSERMRDERSTDE